VTAKFENGLLEVTVPIPEQKDDRRSIPIEGQRQTQAGNEKKAA
jgi:hypothetical protein